MFYKPPSIEKMWDTWMYFHEDTYYLYYLVTESSPGEGVWLSTSNDGVHWQELKMIIPLAEDAQWLGTGAVWPSRVAGEGGSYIMNFSEWRGPSMSEGQQTIFFATSKDLVNWTRLDNSYEFVPNTTWYNKDQGNSSRWDCIYPLEKEDGYYGYWTANPKDFHPGFGFGETQDGVHWQALQPPIIEWGDTTPMPSLEFGAIAPVNNRYYAMLGCYEDSLTMFQFVAEQPQGPFVPAKNNFKILSSAQGHKMSYFSRFFPTIDALLVNHHVITRQDERFFAPLKKASIGHDGDMRLAYWQGNEKAKGQHLSQLTTISEGANFKGVKFLEDLTIEEGNFIECAISEPQTSVSNSKIGFYIEYEEGQGTALQIHPKGIVDFGDLSLNTMTFNLEDSVDRKLEYQEKQQDYQVRLLIRKELLELYLNDVFIQCFSLPKKATGKIGVLFESTTSVIKDLSVYAMAL